MAAPPLPPGAPRHRHFPIALTPHLLPPCSAALRGACDPDPHRPFPPTCRARFGEGGKGHYLSALDGARWLCPLNSRNPCPPACKAALTQVRSNSFSKEGSPRLDQCSARGCEVPWRCAESTASNRPAPQRAWLDASCPPRCPAAWRRVLRVCLQPRCAAGCAAGTDSVSAGYVLL